MKLTPNIKLQDFLHIAADSNTSFSYSQGGEDLVLEHHLRDRAQGFFVDVGAHHPKRYSNTYLLYLRGWSGINIDADPDAIAAFEKHRPRDRNVVAAVSDQSGEAVLTRFDERCMNTISPAQAEAVRHDGHRRVVDEITVRTWRLDTLLERLLPAGRHIDVMNVDAEGMDLAVLQSNDWQRFRPDFLIVEDLGFDMARLQDSAIHAFVSDQGYAPIARTVHSTIYRT